MVALGVDTSNYATSVAVVDTGRREVVCAKKRLLQVPTGQCGLRQSDAVFQHTKALPELFGQLQAAGALSGVNAVGVSEKPRPEEGSYMPCFLAGVSAATAAAAMLGVPQTGTTHQQGHIAAAMYAAGFLDEGNSSDLLVFHMSGGTTELLLAKGYAQVCTVGKSLDLYAGQAIDRLGVSLGYPFPAGPMVSALAAQCEESVSPKISLKGANCHLSGLQNQCEALLAEGKPPAFAAKYCLTAIAKTALGMVGAARAEFGRLPILCAGGVMGSEVIRQIMLAEMDGLYFVPPKFAGDNAVGVAFIAGLEGE